MSSESKAGKSAQAGQGPKLAAVMEYRYMCQITSAYLLLWTSNEHPKISNPPTPTLP
jgi:hypothetical protein